jgi:hypothetical protein
MPAWEEISFAQSWVLWFLFLIPLLIVWYIFKGRKSKPELQISTIAPADTSAAYEVK